MVPSNGGGAELEVMTFRREEVEANAALFFGLGNTNTETQILFFIKCV